MAKAEIIRVKTGNYLRLEVATPHHYGNVEIYGSFDCQGAQKPWVANVHDKKAGGTVSTTTGYLHGVLNTSREAVIKYGLGYHWPCAVHIDADGKIRIGLQQISITINNHVYQDVELVTVSGLEPGDGVASRFDQGDTWYEVLASANDEGMTPTLGEGWEEEEKWIKDDPDAPHPDYIYKTFHLEDKKIVLEVA